MFKQSKVFFLLVLSAVLFTSSCDKDDDVTNPDDPNEGEVITTLQLTFSNGDGSVMTFVAKDENLDGEIDPDTEIEDILLDANTTYAVDVKILNESNPDDVEDVSVEVKEEDDEHQVFFTGSAVSNGLLVHTYEDEDDNGLPVGLQNTIVTTDAGTGELIVTLKHQPEGIKDATSGMDDGDTDLAVGFDVTVQ